MDPDGPPLAEPRIHDDDLLAVDSRQGPSYFCPTAGCGPKPIPTAE
jgi:hypothetical protein